MADGRVKELVARWERLRADRAVLDSHLQDIAELIRPFGADFTVERTPGQRRHDDIFDGTPITAAENLAAGLWGGVTSSAAQWFTLRHIDPDMNRDEAVRMWIAELERRCYTAFSARGQAFYNQAMSFFSDIVTFGTAVMFVDEDPALSGIRFRTRPLHNIWIAEGEDETIDTVFRRFKLTARQAVQAFGEKAPAPAKKAVERGQFEDQSEYLHVVLPRKDYGGSGRLPFASVYICLSDNTIVRDDGGYHEQPYIVARWGRETGEAYGTSAAMRALPDAATLQQIVRTTLVAGQRAAAPPLLAPDDDRISTVRMEPDGITFGAVDRNGNPLIRPLQSGNNFQIDLALAEQARDAVRKAFLANALLLDVQPYATATEILHKRDEQMRLLAPYLGRIMSEFLDPLIGRVVGIIVRAGAVPPPPPILIGNAALQVEYVSPLARQQKAAEAASITRALANILPLAQVAPEVLGTFRWTKLARHLAEVEGVPTELLASEAEQQQAMAALQQAQQASQVAQAAAPTRDFAQALERFVQAERAASEIKRE